MRGFDRINAILPDVLILEIFGHVESKTDRDACSLVCKRWLSLERLSRETIRIGASTSPDELVKLLSCSFVNIRNLFIDERISMSLPVQYGRRRCVSHPSPSSRSFHHGSDLIASEDKGFVTSCLSDSGLAAVGNSLVKLELLSLRWCSSVSNVGLRSFAEKCKLLKCLDLQACYIGDEGLAAIGECCNALEDLNLWYCEGLTDTGLVQLALGCGRTLKSIGIAACAMITDISLEAVGSHCGSLESLKLDSGVFQNKGLLAVAKGCSLLKVLKLHCLNITDEALLAVGIFCSSLESLALYSLQKLTDRSLNAIGEGCRRLKNLMLSDCNFLSNKGLESVAVDCPELISIEINGRHKIGTDGLKSIGKFSTE